MPAKRLHTPPALMTDQFALNAIVYGRNLFSQTEMLPAWCNWTCHTGRRLWEAAGAGSSSRTCRTRRSALCT